MILDTVKRFQLHMVKINTFSLICQEKPALQGLPFQIIAIMFRFLPFYCLKISMLTKGQPPFKLQRKGPPLGEPNQ